MKKSLSALLFFCFVSISLASADVSELEKDFIKGSLSEKITVVQKATGIDALYLALNGIDYSLESRALLGEDRELSALAVASVIALPKTVGQDEEAVLTAEDRDAISDKLIALFNLFDDETVRLSVLERIEVYSAQNPGKSQELLNKYLSNTFDEGKQPGALVKKIIELSSRLGNENSLNILYSIWLSKKWPDIAETTEASLAILSSRDLSGTLKIFSNAELADSARYFDVLQKNSEIPPLFLSEVAENVMVLTINKAETLPDADQSYRNDFLHLQNATLTVIARNKWAHASGIVNMNMSLSKKEFDAGMLDESGFISVINASIQLPTSELAQILSEYLAECNSRVEASKEGTELPSKNVVLALISALEKLGDKTAFDNLLYVTYLPAYPDEVIDAARHALAELKW